MKLLVRTFAQLSMKYGRRAAEPFGLILGIGRSGGLGTPLAATTFPSGALILATRLVAVLVVLVVVVVVDLLTVLRLAKPHVRSTSSPRLGRIL